MPLPEGVRQIGERIVEWHQVSRTANDPPPYQVYVYPPKREWDMRRDLRDLATWLAAPERKVPSVSVSLAEIFWGALEASGWTEELFSQERDAAGDPNAQGEIHRAIAELLRSPVTFSSRVVEAVNAAASERAAVFLYRAGSLYPVFRTSGLLDDIRPRLHVPVTLLYPGELRGDFGLRFMGKWDPTYNYRALIVDGASQSK